MKNRLFVGALMVVGSALNSCGSKSEDATPDYAQLTPIAGKFAIAKNGAASYDLDNLLLKISKNSSGTSDIYEFRGLYNNTQGVYIYFYLDAKRTGTGPFAAQVVTTFYGPDYKAPQLSIDVGQTANFSTANNKFTASYAGPTVAGSLSQ